MKSSPTQRRLRNALRNRLTLSALLGAVALSATAQAGAANYALVMGIGNYSEARANLPGIDLDIQNAAKIARTMGVSDSNITFLANDQLTTDGIRNAFVQMSQRIGRGDNVFIYYSGHGTQYSAGGGKCTEGMVAYDMRAYRDVELQDSLAQLAQKASEVVMMNDSCFSGGQGRSKALSSSVAKTWKMSVETEGHTCGEPINAKLTRNLIPLARKEGSNVLYIAAASENEVAFASPQGSSATLAWLACTSAANDQDHTGVLTGEEIRGCAQNWLNERQFNQHVTLIGNGQLPLSLATGGEAAGYGAQTSPPGESNPMGPRVLGYLRDAASPAIQVSLQLGSRALHINRDSLQFSVSSSQSGYLTILQVGSDGVTFNKIFPNDDDKNNYISAGTSMSLPRSTWEVQSGGPAGTSYLLAIVTETDRDLTKHFQAAGPFRTGQGTKAARNLVVQSVGGGESSGPGRYGASEVVAVREVP